jgi:hypothetical protein
VDVVETPLVTHGLTLRSPTIVSQTRLAYVAFASSRQQPRHK